MFIVIFILIILFVLGVFARVYILEKLLLRKLNNPDYKIRLRAVKQLAERLWAGGFSEPEFVHRLFGIMKDDEHLQGALEIVDQMTNSYHDLHGKDLDFSPFSRDVLVAFCSWNTDVDHDLKVIPRKIEDKVKESKLDRATALSMLYRVDEQQNEEEYGNLTLMVGE